jgi:hypothetical protein
MNKNIINDLSNKPQALKLPYTAVLSAFSAILAGVFISRDFGNY